MRIRREFWDQERFLISRFGFWGFYHLPDIHVKIKALGAVSTLATDEERADGHRGCRWREVIAA